MIAFIAHNLRDALLVAPFAGKKLDSNTVVGNSIVPPALAFFKGRFYLAFVSQNTKKISLLSSQNQEGAGWPTTPTYTSQPGDTSPAMFSRDNLYLAGVFNGTIWTTDQSNNE